MTQTKTAENTQSATLPRPITTIVAAINELIVLCEWIVDAYDTRNDLPVGTRRIVNPALKLTEMPAEISKLLQEGEPWLNKQPNLVRAQSAKVRSLRFTNPGENADREIVTISVHLDGDITTSASRDPHEVPTAIAAVLNWTVTLESLGSALADADQAGDWKKAVTIAEAITSICEQARGAWQPPEGKSAAVLMSKNDGWPARGRLTQAAPEVADKMITAVIQARQHLHL